MTFLNQAPDSAVENLAQSLRTVFELFQKESPVKLTLELYTSTNFLGFFVADNEAEVLKNLALQYLQEVSKYGGYTTVMILYLCS